MSYRVEREISLATTLKTILPPLPRAATKSKATAADSNWVNSLFDLAFR